MPTAPIHLTSDCIRKGKNEKEGRMWPAIEIATRRVVHKYKGRRLVLKNINIDDISDHTIEIE